MNVVHESSNLSETNKINMVSHILNTTPTIPPCETQAEGMSKHYSLQNPSARKLPYSSMVRAPQKMISMFVGDDGSIPSLGIPAAFDPFCLPDNNGAGIFQHLQNTTTFARADSMCIFPTERKSDYDLGLVVRNIYRTDG
jgi:hypothetical protein